MFLAHLLASENFLIRRFYRFIVTFVRLTLGKHDRRLAFCARDVVTTLSRLMQTFVNYAPSVAYNWQ